MGRVRWNRVYNVSVGNLSSVAALPTLSCLVHWGVHKDFSQSWAGSQSHSSTALSLLLISNRQKYQDIKPQ